MRNSLRWRRHRKLVAVTGVGFLVLVVGFGDVRVTAITSSERRPSDAFVRDDIRGLVDLFDDEVIHEIAVTFDPDDYDRMIATYQEEGRKEYIEASVTIDGAVVSSVGLRLKGNSTLTALRRGGSVDDPSRLPWLLRFDAFVKGQRYQGYEEIAIRPRGPTQTLLSEPLALDLIAAGGEPSQRASYSSFVVNGGAAALRLVVEVPGDRYAADTFATDGVLYKARPIGRFAYLGEDPLAYEDAFEQITRTNRQDLKPLIELLRWGAQASDEEFAAELVAHVDVEALARYLALHALLRNYDDMGGPGQNYYLWYDLETERFTVLTWDLNLAFDRRDPRGPTRNALKDRFLATPAFRTLYDAAYEDLGVSLFAGGRAISALERRADLLRTSELVDPMQVETAVANLRTLIERQTPHAPPAPAPACRAPFAAAPRSRRRWRC